MNKYEKFVAYLGFENPKQGKTRAPANELVGVVFTGYKLEVVKERLGKSKAHKPNVFFYRFSNTRACLVDLERNRVLLGNSTRAVDALAKTVNR